MTAFAAQPPLDPATVRSQRVPACTPMPARRTALRPFTEWFSRVRVISLVKRHDRRRETRAEFARHALPFEGGRVAFFDALSPTAADGFPTSGVRGCFLSHLAVLEAAVADGVDSVLILEDDIAFARRIASLGNDAVSTLDTMTWDLAYLGHDVPSGPGETGWRPVTGPMRHSHFYAVHRRALGRLVTFLRDVLGRPPGHPDGGPMHYDGALSTFRAQNPDLKIIHYTASLGYQRPSRTDIHAPSALDRYRWLAPVKVAYRTAKRAYWHAVR